MNLLDERLAALATVYAAPSSNEAQISDAFARFKTAYAEFLEALRVVAARFNSYDRLADSLNNETAARSSEFAAGAGIYRGKYLLQLTAVVYCAAFFIFACFALIKFLPAGFKKWRTSRKIFLEVQPAV